MSKKIIYSVRIALILCLAGLILYKCGGGGGKNVLKGAVMFTGPTTM